MRAKGKPMKPVVTLVPSETKTSIVMRVGTDEVLRAVLPPLDRLRHPRAAGTLLEALSLWSDERLCVALCAAAREDFFRFDLTDELGAGVRRVFYAVEVVDREPRRGRRIRLGDVGPAQLSLVTEPRGAR
jgi:hypothetical protein